MFTTGIRNVINMECERKWVLDSKLDKLWNETIEKKEANRQKRSPDFYKQAILSATLKRVSSEMLVGRFSEPMLDIEFNSEDLLSKFSTKVDDSDYLKLDNALSYYEKTYTDLVKPDSTLLQFQPDNSDFESTFNDLYDDKIDCLTEMHDVKTSGNESPKRKQSDLYEDERLVEYSTSLSLQESCSPAKRQRVKSGKNFLNTSTKHSIRRLQQRTNSDELLSSVSDVEHSVSELKIIHFDDVLKFDQNKLSANSLLFPINGMTELSFGLKGEWQSNSQEHDCQPGDEKFHKDLLELDEIFQELEPVKS